MNTILLQPGPTYQSTLDILFLTVLVHSLLTTSIDT